MTAKQAGLRPYPGTPVGAVAAIEAAVVPEADGALQITFRLRGDLGRLRIPAPAPAGAADGLWRHTCFEAFVAERGQPAYREFNFSPSGEWATYRFADYRRQIEEDAPLPPPELICHRMDALVVAARLDAAALPSGPTLRIGLSAVVEGLDGGLSYWALAHPAERPDFHHPAAFALSVHRAAAPGAP